MRLDRLPYHNRLIRGPAKVGSWHKSEVPRRLLYRRYRGKSGSDTDIVKRMRMTRIGLRLTSYFVLLRLRSCQRLRSLTPNSSHNQPKSWVAIALFAPTDLAE